MQDRYAGDIGDYGKIGLLKCLQGHGFDIGVNWYRVPVLDVEKKGRISCLITLKTKSEVGNSYMRIGYAGKCCRRS